jgi:uncharacterized protein YPO0396
MRLITSHHHVRPEYNTIGNTLQRDNGTQMSEFQATEEELAASQYKLSEVEALLLHLNDRKQLLSERIGRLNNAILLKQNRQHVYHCGVSTVKSITHKRCRTKERKWQDMG